MRIFICTLIMSVSMLFTGCISCDKSPCGSGRTEAEIEQADTYVPWWAK